MIFYLFVQSPSPTIQDSRGHSISSTNPAELLDFLIFGCTSTHPTSTLRAFWDVDAVAQHILSLLPVTVRESVTKTNRAVWGSYRLFYINGKMLGISKSHEDVTFYDLSQYYPDKNCQTISQVQEKADLLLETLVGLGITSPIKLTSPVAVWETANKLPDISTIYDIPEMYWEAFEYALQCTPREWVSAYQIGSWGERGLFDYDQVSAYPFVASQLLDLRDCAFTRLPEQPQEKSYSSTITIRPKIDSAYYGFLCGDLWIDPTHPLAWCSPVVVNLDGKLCNPVGHLPTDYYPLDQIRFVERHEMGTFKLKSGWLISPYGSVHPRQPFRDLMSQLYSDRDRSPLASYFLKRVMNGLVGRMLQSVKKDGEIVKYSDSYNPIYHAIITSETKIRVAEFIINNNIQRSELVHVGVDGIKSTRDIPLSSNSSRMGQWVNRGSQPTVVLSPGRIYIPTRPKNGETYHLLKAITEVHPNQRHYEFGNTVVDLDVLRLDTTRNFPKFPRTGSALMSNHYVSEPIVL